jgi:hypothetical protein
METNYTPNSKKYKEALKEAAAEKEQKNIQAVVNGPVTVKKKTGTQKVLNSLIAEDVPKIKNYIVSDVLIPSIKKAVSDIVRNGIDMLLYGEAGRSRDSKSTVTKVSYGGYYNNPGRADRDRDRDRYVSRSGFDYDEYSFTNRGDAEIVLDQMEGIIQKYGFVKVADYYDLIGVTNTNHCANNYGWTDIHHARIVRERDGYTISLPRPLAID